MDNVEKVIEGGVNAFRSMVRDPKFIPGAGATEMVIISFYSLVLISSIERIC